MDDYVYICRSFDRYAHMQMEREAIATLRVSSEGEEVLLSEIERLMGGKADHEHVFVMDLGSLTLKDSYIYECTHKGAK